MRDLSALRGRRYSDELVEGLAQSQVELLEALRAGDEAAFARIVDELSPGLMRLARVYVSTDSPSRVAVRFAGSSRT